MNAPFNPMRLPEAGPITPPEYDFPEPPEVHVSDVQIIERVTACLSGQADTAFGQEKRYWGMNIRDWRAEWDYEKSDMDLIDVDQAPDQIRHTQQMMCIHARELLRDDRVPIECLEEEGLI